MKWQRIRAISEREESKTEMDRQADTRSEKEKEKQREKIDREPKTGIYTAS